MWVIIGILVLVIAALTIKIYLMRKSVKEITEAFSEKLTTDTNTLISLSSNDKEMKKLADGINGQLKILREERLKFSQGNVELKTAVTNISHDLRTPLTAICGYLELLKAEEKSEEVGRCLDIIENRTQSLKQLTEELFKYSVVISTDDELKFEEVVINSVLEESIAAYYGALKERGIEPTVSITDNQIIRYLDRAALSRVFANILSNAVKYSDGGLEIKMTDSGEITFANTTSNLDEIQVGKLFDRFYTVEAARNSTGLGLSIARNLTQRMNGQITASYSNGRLVISVILFLNRENKGCLSKRNSPKS